jgi:hypothetical protein
MKLDYSEEQLGVDFFWVSGTMLTNSYEPSSRLFFRRHEN